MEQSDSRRLRSLPAVGERGDCVCGLPSRRTVYDCLYVALAVQSKTAMVSDDRRLVNALIDGPLKDHVAWLGAEE